MEIGRFLWPVKNNFKKAKILKCKAKGEWRKIEGVINEQGKPLVIETSNKIYDRLK